MSEFDIRYSEMYSIHTVLAILGYVMGPKIKDQQSKRKGHVRRMAGKSASSTSMLSSAGASASSDPASFNRDDAIEKLSYPMLNAYATYPILLGKDYKFRSKFTFNIDGENISYKFSNEEKGDWIFFELDEPEAKTANSEFAKAYFSNEQKKVKAKEQIKNKIETLKTLISSLEASKIQVLPNDLSTLSYFPNDKRYILDICALREGEPELHYVLENNKTIPINLDQNGAGWKIHISIDETDDKNFNIAWDIVLWHMVKYQMPSGKIISTISVNNNVKANISQREESKRDILSSEEYDEENTETDQSEAEENSMKSGEASQEKEEELSAKVSEEEEARTEKPDVEDNEIEENEAEESRMKCDKVFKENAIVSEDGREYTSTGKTFCIYLGPSSLLEGHEQKIIEFIYQLTKSLLLAKINPGFQVLADELLVYPYVYYRNDATEEGFYLESHPTESRFNLGNDTDPIGSRMKEYLDANPLPEVVTTSPLKQESLGALVKKKGASPFFTISNISRTAVAKAPTIIDMAPLNTTSSDQQEHLKIDKTHLYAYESNIKINLSRELILKLAQINNVADKEDEAFMSWAMWKVEEDVGVGIFLNKNAALWLSLNRLGIFTPAEKKEGKNPKFKERKFTKLLAGIVLIYNSQQFNNIETFINAIMKPNSIINEELQKLKAQHSSGGRRMVGRRLNALS